MWYVTFCGVDCVAITIDAVYSVHDEWPKAVPWRPGCHGKQNSIAAAADHQRKVQSCPVSSNSLNSSLTFIHHLVLFVVW